jgi:hypothetical protein
MEFGGKSKVGSSLLGPIEQRFIRWAVPRVPHWIHSYQLTLWSGPLKLDTYSHLAEIRIAFIIINALIAIMGKTHLAGALPWILLFSFSGLIFLIYRTQQGVFERDMSNKKLTDHP